MSSSQALIRLTNFLYCRQSNFFIHKETGLNTRGWWGREKWKALAKIRRKCHHASENGSKNWFRPQELIPAHPTESRSVFFPCPPGRCWREGQESGGHLRQPCSSTSLRRGYAMADPAGGSRTARVGAHDILYQGPASDSDTPGPLLLRDPRVHDKQPL